VSRAGLSGWIEWIYKIGFIFEDSLGCTGKFDFSVNTFLTGLKGSKGENYSFGTLAFWGASLYSSGMTFIRFWGVPS
jgi:hypothetical protein